MEVRLVYFEGCPSWQLARERLRQGLDRLGRAEVSIGEVQVKTADEATAAGFAGSPTILIDGRDLFPRSTVWAGGLGCRLYRTPTGSAGVPRVDDIMSALSEKV